MHKTNLTKLAEYLKTIDPKNFNMITYHNLDEFLTKKYLASKKYCPTVACVLGHAPMIPGFELIPEDFDINEDTISWSRYSNRIFQIPYNEIWNWLFSGEWTATDNSLSGAIKRIEYIIKYRLPVTWVDQVYGFHPLSYLTEVPAYQINQIVMFENEPTEVCRYKYTGSEYLYGIGKYRLEPKFVKENQLKSYEQKEFNNIS